MRKQKEKEKSQLLCDQRCWFASFLTLGALAGFIALILASISFSYSDSSRVALQGIGKRCWDGNLNKKCDLADEDIDGDGACTIFDCIGEVQVSSPAILTDSIQDLDGDDDGITVYGGFKFNCTDDGDCEESVFDIYSVHKFNMSFVTTNTSEIVETTLVRQGSVVFFFVPDVYDTCINNVTNIVNTNDTLIPEMYRPSATWYNEIHTRSSGVEDVSPGRVKIDSTGRVTFNRPSSQDFYGTTSNSCGIRAHNMMWPL